MADKDTAISTTSRQAKETRPAHRSQAEWGPWNIVERLADEMDRVFDDFGFGRRAMSFPFSRSTTMTAWTPQIEVFQRNNELVIKADLPGMKKDDIKVDVRDDAVTIQGERRREHEEEREGVFRSERSYGSFYRMVPLPEGAIAEQAKAQFRDGVLEITMPTPPEQVTRGRRLEISEGKK